MRVEAGRVEPLPHRDQRVGVDVAVDVGVGVVELEVLLDAGRCVSEVDDQRSSLAGVDPVQPGEGLHGGDARELLIDVHRHEARLVEAGLELVRDDEDAVDALLAERPADVAHAVHGHLGDALAVLVGERAGERREGMHVVALLGDVRVHLP